MKIKILSIATILLIVASISSKTFAAGKNISKTAEATATTLLENVSNINKIEVHGNVQLYVTNGLNDKIKVYDNYYNQNALVQEQDGVLRISSYKNEKLVVWVTVADLKLLSAYDNASVESFGKFSALDFSLNLNNSATANFNMDCIEAKIAVSDSAKANISGNASQTSLVINQSATVNATQLIADNISTQRVQPKAKVLANVLDELAFN
ncbi:MAG: DUF2807 domain-containing protein [Mucilaginibacter sp.]|uniref:GIN domain-containing protein n=1 Tax=Mucilaginibacter sp. TaxID=1882438 RepID=UPI0032643E3B